tara:strand:- start:8678 stop:9637 length:960 start_codon:yes stop_codon:yes gene_type:complete
MAGILNNKERSIDFVITHEGKRQAGTGEMQIHFATFTDMHTFYESSGSQKNPDLAEDASDRVFFEAHDRFQDVIIPELEAGFSLRPFRTQDFDIAGGALVSGSVNTGIMTHPNIISGSDLSVALPRVLDGITKNLTDQRIIKTIDEFSFYQQVKIAPLTGTFNIKDSTNYFRAEKGIGSCHLEQIPSIFSDRRFADFPNFKYLPPVNVPLPGATEGVPLANYPKLNEREIISIDDLLKSLKGKPNIDFEFTESSRANNIIVQFFEQDLGGIQKLSVVDFGEFTDDDPTSPGKRVFYVGKIMRDGFGSETFLCIFTVVLD